jgi:hypothetical protein
MAYTLSRLPSRFPVGTKFVIEGRRSREGQVQISRHLEFPDGTLLPLPARPAARRPAKRKTGTSGRSRRTGGRRR